MSILARDAGSDGRHDLVEGWCAADTRTPPHRPATYDEQVCVLEGGFKIRIGRGEAVLRASEDLYIPAGEPHAVAATMGGPAWGLVSGDGAPLADPPDVEHFLRVSAEVKDELLGPPGALLE